MEAAEAGGPPPFLHQVHAGETGPRVVLVHGFTQTHVSWMAVATDLDRDHRVVAVDLPGHGGSGHVRGDLWRTAALAADVGPGTWVGYSMGARVALHVALARPAPIPAFARQL